MTTKTRNWAEIIHRLIERSKVSPSEAEAEALLSKANELMERYQIDMAELGPEKNDPIIRQDGNEFSSTSHSWMWDLYAATAAYYGCQCIRENFFKWKKKRNGDDNCQLHYRMVLVGRESAVITAELMYEFLVREVYRHGKRISQFTGMTPAGQSRRVGAALIHRIYRLIPPKKEAQSAAYQKYALVTMDQVEAEVRRQFPNLGDNWKLANVRTDQESLDAAMSINLNLQTKGSKGTKQLGAGYNAGYSSRGDISHALSRSRPSKSHKAACGAEASDTGEPFDPESVYSCKHCIRELRLELDQ